MSAERKQLLVVDDEPNLRRVLSAQLTRDGYDVHTAEDGEQGLQMLADHHFDLVISDLKMPKVDGMQLLRAASVLEPQLPGVIITAHGTVDNAVEALKTGAFDYITKPFSPRELGARLKSLLRRVTPRGIDQVVEVDQLILDPVSHRATAQGSTLELGPTEYRLLQFFMTHQDRAYSRTQLLDMVWGGNVYVEERTVDVHIRRLRKALGERHEYLVQTVRGTGYRFSTQTQ